MNDIIKRLQEIVATPFPSMTIGLGNIETIAEAVSEIERLRSERQRTDDLIEEVKRVLGPFNQMAGELFSRNWNASDLVLALDNQEQENRLTAGDLFAVRALLSKLEER